MSMAHVFPVGAQVRNPRFSKPSLENKLLLSWSVDLRDPQHRALLSQLPQTARALKPGSGTKILSLVFAHTELTLSERMPGHMLSCQLPYSLSWRLLVGWRRWSVAYPELVASPVGRNTRTHDRSRARGKTTSGGHPVFRHPAPPT